MVHFIALYQLAKEVDDAKIDELMRTSRSMLLRIQEVHNVRSGKRIDPKMDYPFSIAMDFENLDKLAMFREDPLWLKFQRDHLESATTQALELIYETEPGKNLKYS
ncbi:MAG: Dabb family protein [Verrucomicrobiae bacterium]|nr:Dabb family protein [Verrucomicrobiae bacterium]